MKQLYKSGVSSYILQQQNISNLSTAMQLTNTEICSDLLLQRNSEASQELKELINSSSKITVRKSWVRSDLVL